MRSVYIHIPFCENICSYCDFCKMFYNEKMVDSYLDELHREIKETYQNDLIKSIYIGGGTPSCLNIKQLEKLFSIINIFKKDKDFSFTIEGNFESTSFDKLQLYKKNNVTRLSFGLESVNENNLKFLDRKCDILKIKETIFYAKKLGFDINIDLMYALPTEDMTILNKDLDFILSLDVNHISTYSLIIEDHTKLKINNVQNISEDLDYLMYETICKRLKEKGYLHYEISNFAKEGFASVHNLCYWQNQEYYGFGLGASSYLSNKRMTNTKSITQYLKGLYSYYEEVLTKKEVIEYEIILRLRLNRGISLKEFFEKYHKNLLDIYDYQELLALKLLNLEEDRLFIPEEKWYISNEIIRRLLEAEVHG